MVYICIKSKYKNDCSTILRPWTDGYLQNKFKVENVIYCDVFYLQAIKVPNPRSQMTPFGVRGYLYRQKEKKKEDKKERREDMGYTMENLKRVSAITDVTFLGSNCRI